MVAVEKSPEAAAWLNKNIAKYDLPIRVVIEDVATALPDVKADVVVANPPYIPNDEKLPIEVANFEPEMALRGGPVDGMQIPKLFIDAATRLLKPGGLLIIDQALSGGKVADPTQRDPESIARRDAIKVVKEDERWAASLIPIGAGVLVANKLT